MVTWTGLEDITMKSRGFLKRWKILDLSRRSHTRVRDQDGAPHTWPQKQMGREVGHTHACVCVSKPLASFLLCFKLWSSRDLRACVRVRCHAKAMLHN